VGKEKQTPRRWVPVHDQLPDVLIERHRAVTLSPEVHGAYARTVREKAEKFGVIHVDPDTGYRARFPLGQVPEALQFVPTGA
jgi:hypothetical protein